MDSSIVISHRGQPVKPQPPVTEEVIESWNLPEEKRVLALQLVRYVTKAHDEFLDAAVKLETSHADARYNLQVALIALSDSAARVRRAEAETEVLRSILAKAATIIGVQIDATGDRFLGALMELDLEVLQYRSTSRAGSCANCHGPHFTQDCDVPR